MSILINILLACNGKFYITIQEGALTEPVVLFIGHYIHYKTMSSFFFFFFFCVFSDNYYMVK